MIRLALSCSSKLNIKQYLKNVTSSFRSLSKHVCAYLFFIYLVRRMKWTRIHCELQFITNHKRQKSDTKTIHNNFTKIFC